MKRSARLRPVEKIASHHERKAAMELGAARQEVAAKHNRLIELQTYKTEYISQFESRGRQSIPADQLQGFQVFLDNLTLAIKQQQEIVASSEQLVAHRFAVWQECHKKLKMLESITSRYVASESALAEKLAQKEIDELGQRIYQFYKK